MTITKIGNSEFIQDFHLYDVYLENGITLRTAIAGEGEPLVLLHGHPQSHVTWHKVAPLFAKKYTVIVPDLRGYGDSSKPNPLHENEKHRTYSKKLMAQDIVLLMKTLGFERFLFIGHDRGARVGHRLALDYPEQVSLCVFIDIAPTLTMYEQTNKAFATLYFWWFFLIQPFPLPETMIGADPKFYLRHHIDGQLKTKGATDERIFNEYLRCYQNPKMIHAVCEDYRAAATIDLADDKADSDERIQCPLLVLWGEKGTVGKLYDVIATWQAKAINVQGQGLPCGHTLQEELPEQLILVVQQFFDKQITKQ